MFKPTASETDVLLMMNGDKPWERGAWVNACVEFLEESGYATKSGTITDKGKQYLKSIDLSNE